MATGVGWPATCGRRSSAHLEAARASPSWEAGTGWPGPNGPIGSGLDQLGSAHFSHLA
jgi:hypothetical protein